MLWTDLSLAWHHCLESLQQEPHLAGNDQLVLLPISEHPIILQTRAYMVSIYCSLLSLTVKKIAKLATLETCLNTSSHWPRNLHPNLYVLKDENGNIFNRGWRYKSKVEEVILCKTVYCKRNWRSWYSWRSKRRGRVHAWTWHLTKWSEGSNKSSETWECTWYWKIPAKLKKSGEEGVKVMHKLCKKMGEWKLGRYQETIGHG